MIIETTIALILMFSLLVVIHELGHFLVAKKCGMRVHEFALGFGPRIATLANYRGTEYTIHLVPLGGFVRIAGMEPGEENLPDGFNAKPTWMRAAVVFMGPLASFALAVVTFVCVGLFFGFPDFSAPQNRVGSVSPQTEAARIGLRAGDRIVEINGTKINNGEELVNYIKTKPGENLDIVVKRNGETVKLNGTPKWNVQFGGINWSFMKSDKAIVEAVDLEIKKMGVEPGDELVSINGKPINGGADFVNMIQENGVKPVSVLLKRGEGELKIELTPKIEWITFLDVKWVFPFALAPRDGTAFDSARKYGINIEDVLLSINGSQIIDGKDFLNKIASLKPGEINLEIARFDEKLNITINLSEEEIGKIRSGYYDSRGLLGFLVEPSLKRTGFIKSVKYGVIGTWDKVKAIIGSITSGRIKEDVGGPIMIAKATAQSVALGVPWVLMTMGMLSLSLAVINLLPVPLFDGGHLAIMGIESIRRKRFSEQQIAFINMIGIALIGMLIVFVFYSDIFKISKGLVPQ